MIRPPPAQVFQPAPKFLEVGVESSDVDVRSLEIGVEYGGKAHN